MSNGITRGQTPLSDEENKSHENDLIKKIASGDINNDQVSSLYNIMAPEGISEKDWLTSLTEKANDITLSDVGSAVMAASSGVWMSMPKEPVAEEDPPSSYTKNKHGNLVDANGEVVIYSMGEGKGWESNLIGGNFSSAEEVVGALDGTNSGLEGYTQNRDGNWMDPSGEVVIWKKIKEGVAGWESQLIGGRFNTAEDVATALNSKKDTKEEVEVEEVDNEEKVAKEQANSEALNNWFEENLGEIDPYNGVNEIFNKEDGFGAQVEIYAGVSTHKIEGGENVPVDVSIYTTANSDGAGDTYIEREKYYVDAGDRDEGEVDGTGKVNVGRPEDYSWDTDEQAWFRGRSVSSKGVKVLEKDGDSYTSVESQPDPDIAQALGDYLDDMRADGLTSDFEGEDQERREAEIKDLVITEEEQFDQDGNSKGSIEADFDPATIADNLENEFPNLQVGREGEGVEMGMRIMLADGTFYHTGYKKYGDSLSTDRGAKDETIKAVVEIKKKYEDDAFRIKASEPMWGIFELEDHDTYHSRLAGGVGGYYSKDATYNNLPAIQEALKEAGYTLTAGIKGASNLLVNTFSDAFTLESPDGAIHELKSPSELQKYLWDNMTPAERRRINEYAVNSYNTINEELTRAVDAAFVNGVRADSQGTKHFEIQDDPLTDEDESVYSHEIIQAAFHGGGEDDIDTIFHKNIKSDELRSRLRGYDNEGLLVEDEDSRIKWDDYSAANGGKSALHYDNFKNIQEQYWFKNLTEDEQADVLNAAGEAMTFIDLKVSETIDGQVTQERSVLLESLLAGKYSHQANLYRGVIDQKVNTYYVDPEYRDVVNYDPDADMSKYLVEGTGLYVTTETKQKALVERGEVLLAAAGDKTEELQTTITAYLSEVADTGFGYHSEGDLAKGTYRIVIDAPDGEEFEGKRTEFQTRINDLYATYDTIEETFNIGSKGLYNDYSKFVSEVELGLGDLETANKDFDLAERRWQNWSSGFEGMWAQLTGDEGAQLALQNRELAFKSALTYDEAMRTGQFADYYGSTVVSQLPNMVVAMAVQTAGVAVGIPPMITSIAIGGIYGLSEQEGTRFRMVGDRNRSFEAEESLSDLNKAYKNGSVSDAQYYNIKSKLQNQIVLGRYTDSQINGMRATTGLAEFVIAGAFSYVGGGSIGNAYTNLSRLGLGEVGESLVGNATKKWYQHVASATLDFGFELSTEVAEETLIYATGYFGEVGILDKEFDWSDLGEGARETALSTIISAGSTQGASGAKGVINNLVVSNKARVEVAGINNILKGLQEDLKNPDLTSRERENLMIQIDRKYQELGGIDSRLQVRALIAGPDGLDTLVRAQGDLIAVQSEAGVKAGDSQDTIDKKVADYRDKLSDKKKASFDRRTQRALDIIQVEHDNVDQALEGDPMIVVEKVYGENGTKIANELSQKQGWDDLDNADKVQAVHNQVMENSKQQRINSARNDAAIMAVVEKVVYGGTFDESGKTDRDIDAENYYLDNIASNIIINEGSTTLSATQGRLSLEAISSDPDFKDKIKVKQFDTVQDLYDDIKKRRDSGEITSKEYNDLISGLKKMEKTKETSNVFGALIGENYITLSNEEETRQLIREGRGLPAGTVALHETSHLLDNLAGITGATALEYENMLVSALINSGDPTMVKVHVDAMQRLKDLNNGLAGTKDAGAYDVGTELHALEYTVAVQDAVANKTESGRKNLAAMRKLSGKKSWTDIFKKRTEQDLSKGFQINTPKNALNYMVANIDAFSSGKVSVLTQSRIDAGLGSNFDGNSRMSAVNKQASTDVQNIYENEYKKKGDVAEGKILGLMELPIANMAERVGALTNWDNFDQGMLEDEITSSIKRRGATALVRDYDLRSAEYILKDGKKVNALVSKKGMLTINGEEVGNVDYYFKDPGNPTQGEIDIYITDQFGAIEKRNQVPLAGYVFQQLKLRMPEFINNAKLRTAEGFTLDASELSNLLGTDEDFSENADIVEGREAGNILLANQLGDEGAAIAEQTIGLYETGEIDADGKTYNSLAVPNEVFDSVFKMMGIDPLTKKGTRKTGNLDNTDVLNAQRWIDKNLQVLKNAIPLHHTVKMISVPVIEGGVKKVDDQGRVVKTLTARPDKATGIPKVILNAMFDEGTRKDNMTPWMPKDMLDSEVKAVFGITKRGEQNLFKKDTNTSQRVRGAASIIAKAMVNQSVKIAKMQAGDGSAFSFEDGKNPVLFSAEVRKIASNNPMLASEIIGVLQSDRALNILKTGDNVGQSFKALFNDQEMERILKASFPNENIYYKDGGIKKSYVNKFKLDKIAADIQTLFDKYSPTLKEGKFNMPMLDRSIAEIIQGHIVDDATNHREQYKDLIGEDNMLDVRTEDGKKKAQAGTIALVNRLKADGHSSAWIERFIMPGLVASYDSERGYFMIPPADIGDFNQDGEINKLDQKDWVRNTLGVVVIDKTEFKSSPSIATRGNLDNDGVKKVRDNIDPIQAAQIENNKAFRVVEETLAMQVATKEITIGQAQAILAVMNANQQGLTRSSAITDFLPTKPFKLIPAFNKDGTKKYKKDGNGEVIRPLIRVMYGATLEHMTPALLINMQALRSIAEARVDKDGNLIRGEQHAEFINGMDNYRIALLPKAYDNMVNENNKSTVPFWQKLTDSPLGRYFGPLMLALGMDLEMEQMSTGIKFGGETGIDTKTWKLLHQNRKKALGNLAKGTSIATDQKTEHDARKATVNMYSSTDRSGMSAWDFDDTLATTRSGVGVRIPNPSGSPKPGRKVIFMAGGAGSGKGSVIKGLGLEKAGYKVVNSDISLEWLKKNHGLPENQSDYTSEQRSQLSKLTWEARKIAKKKQGKFAGNGDGVVIDGTGGSVKTMEKLVQEFKDKGYDVSMVFVETSLKVAQERNAARKDRTLREGILNKNHEQVQGNKEAFKQLFGENYNEVSTDNLGVDEAMPKKFKDKLDDFTNSYEKRRLDAEEFAKEGGDIKANGGEFDFSEFNKVIGGEKGPMFKAAFERAKKYGTEDTFILTARGQEAAPAIKEFLDALGLNIPIENITGLGDSTPAAKARWMLDKYASGYNDMYFADDVKENVDAVREGLSKEDVKIKAELAKLKEEASINDIKDPKKLADPGTYNNIKFSAAHRSEYENTISKSRPDLVRDGLVSKTVDDMFSFIDGLNVPADKKRKYERVTTKWLATSNVIMTEDKFKITDAIEIAEKFKVDVFSYNNPNEIIEAYAGKTTKAPINPSKVTEFGPGVVTNEEYNITEHVVDDTREGQKAVRDIIDSHWGEKSNPWCITQKKHGKLTEGSWDNWLEYSDKPKSIVFQDGKLLAFKANGLHWDRMDNDTKHPIVNVKEGRVTTKVELTKKGRTIERVTVSEDGKTTTTEYLRDTNANSKGEKTVEERNNGKKTKVTEFSVRKVKSKVTTFDTNGNVTGIRGYDSLGWMSALNNIGLHRLAIPVAEFLGKEGDIATREYYDSDTREYTFSGMVLHEGGARNISWKALDGAIGADLKNVTHEVDGKTRLDLKKILKLDPNAKGIPGTVDAKTGFTDEASRSILSPRTIPDLRGNIMFSAAAQDVFNEFDTKGTVEAARVKFSSEASRDFNAILEYVMGVEKEKTFSGAKARQRGSEFRKFQFFLPPSAEDFKGLIYKFLGKGKKGEAHFQFFKENLMDPFSKGSRRVESIGIEVASDLKALKRTNKDANKKLDKKVSGTNFTNEQALRVYNWTQNGVEVPGLSQADATILNNAIKNDVALKLFADGVRQIQDKPGLAAEPGANWMGGTITMDISETIDASRDVLLGEFNENADIIFSEENLNKIQAIYGDNFREALEDSLYRMKTGSTRSSGSNRIVNRFTQWINGSIGTTMFMNTRSSMLQMMSNINFINWSDNNPLKAAKAFANQKQYWTDVAMIFNSDFLKSRRSKIGTDLNASELLKDMSGSKNKMKTITAKLLQLGFTPTQIADNLAIATGGATMYRNRIGTYLKQGMSQADAEAAAFSDMQEVAEETQQSTRPDKISQQQASPLGKWVLAFQNTPMQYNRIMKRSMQDMVNGRGDNKEHISKIAYYGGIQSMIFYGLQTAMFTAMFDDEEDEEDFKKKQHRVINGMMDSILRGTGVGGAVVATVKNLVLKHMAELEKLDDDKFYTDYDEGKMILELLNISPPIGIKARKFDSGLKTWKYNRDVIDHMSKTDLDNPIYDASFSIIESATNIPLSRLYNKLLNLRAVGDSDNELYKRIAMFLGYSRWSFGIQNQDVITAKSEVKEIKAAESEVRANQRQADRDAERVVVEEAEVQENIATQEEERQAVEDAETDKEREQAEENVTCAAVNRSGKRCSNNPVGGGTYCTIHEEVKQNADGEKSQCSHVKDNGDQCKMQTSNQSGKCYYHD